MCDATGSKLFSLFCMKAPLFSHRGDGVCRSAGLFLHTQVITLDLPDSTYQASSADKSTKDNEAVLYFITFSMTPVSTKTNTRLSNTFLLTMICFLSFFSFYHALFTACSPPPPPPPPHLHKISCFRHAVMHCPVHFVQKPKANSRKASSRKNASTVPGKNASHMV